MIFELKNSFFRTFGTYVHEGFEEVVVGDASFVSRLFEQVEGPDERDPPLAVWRLNAVQRLQLILRHDTWKTKTKPRVARPIRTACKDTTFPGSDDHLLLTSVETRST